MLPTLAVALFLGAAAPLLRAWMMGVPLGLLSVGMVLRSFVSASITVLVFGAFTFALAAPERRLLAALVALGLATPLVLLSSMRWRRLRGALLLAYRLKDDIVREQSLRALTRLVERSRPKATRPSTPHVQLLLMLAAPLTAFGLSAQLEHWLSQAPCHDLDPRTAALRAQTLATCRVEAGDVKGAAEALEAVPESGVDPLLEGWLVATRALLLAVSDEPEEALEMLGPDAEDLEATLLASRCIVRAHVLATRGDESGAESELREALESVGVSALDRAARPEGPASALAERLAHELQEQASEELDEDEEFDEDEELDQDEEFDEDEDEAQAD